MTHALLCTMGQQLLLRSVLGSFVSYTIKRPVQSYGKPTIVAKTKGKCKIGQRTGFSDTDIRKLNTLYQCKGYAQVGSGASGSKPKPTEKPWVKPTCVDTNK